MKNIDLLDSMQLVDDKYVEEAAKPVKSKTINIYYYVSLAASVVLALLSGGWILLDPAKETKTAARQGQAVATTISNDGEFASIVFVLSSVAIITIIVLMIVNTIQSNRAAD